MYGTLRDWLRESEPDHSLVAFPDGSRDVRCTLSAGERLATRDALADWVADRRRSALALDRDTIEPGGQAVNVAQQAHRLGSETTLFGHLDDPLFDGLPFETHSMGPPATVYVSEFDDGVLMLVDHGSRDRWTLADLRAAAPDPLTADAVVGANWSSFPAMTDALETLAGEGLSADIFVIDPGDVTARPSQDRRAFVDALAALDDRTDVVLTANRDELRSLVAAAGGTAPDGDDREADERLAGRVRDEGVPTVLHERKRAVAATDGGRQTVPNLDIERTARHAGGGDRFTAGLAHALAAGADIELAMALGNTCASRYVATGKTGDREALVSFLNSRR